MREGVKEGDQVREGAKARKKGKGEGVRGWVGGLIE